MGRITDALKKVTDERVKRIQKKPELQYVVKKVANTKVDEHIVAFHDPASTIGEQYKIIRTNIQSLKITKSFKTFLITSATHSEGKSITSVNLALTLAHDLNDKSILLIDADMRKGKAARYLGLDINPGLSEVLKGDIEVDQALVSPDIGNLTILPCGKAPKNPSELLGSKRMNTLLASLKTRFDYIFIDSPPVMPVTDPCILGAMVDGVIMVIQAGRTQRDLIKQVENRLNQAQATLIGYILTNVEYHLPQYLYRYAQEYGAYDAYYKRDKETETVEA